MDCVQEPGIKHKSQKLSLNFRGFYETACAMYHAEINLLL